MLNVTHTPRPVVKSNVQFQGRRTDAALKVVKSVNTATGNQTTKLMTKFPKLTNVLLSIQKFCQDQIAMLPAIFDKL